MPVTTNTRKLAALLGASGAGIGTDGLMQPAGIDADMATQAELDITKTNQAIIAIRQAADHNDVKYNLQDRTIDTYYDNSGIDTGASTNEILASGAYYGETTVTPTISHDADATGTDGDYTWYKWTDTASTGSYTTDTAQNYDYIVVAGGGGSGRGTGSTGANGGGGAGGLLTAASLSFGAATYTMTIGAGGAGRTGSNGRGTSGGNSSIAGSGITDIVATGGGAGGAGYSGIVDGLTGGSGGGAAGSGSGGAKTASPVQGNDGGDGPAGGGGGGGGAGAAGPDGSGNTGGDGAVGASTFMGMNATNSTSFLAAVSAGDLESSTRYLAGGGAAGSNWDNTSYAGGHGGGGDSGNHNAVGTAGTANTGGGAGASGYSNQNGVAGGSGIIIIRRLTNDSSLTGAGGDLTLQSTDTEAETQPTEADMVMLIEDNLGTATINTDIKGYISRDSGTTFTQGTLVDEGDWGTNKRILAFHDLDISGQPADKTMCYKITTHNQVLGSKVTKIHATSIGWK